jgi:hypothetical protein
VCDFCCNARKQAIFLLCPTVWDSRGLIQQGHRIYMEKNAAAFDDVGKKIKEISNFKAKTRNKYFFFGLNITRL